MRTAFKNKLALLGIIALIFPLLWTGYLLPRTRIITSVVEEGSDLLGNVVDIYDIYICDFKNESDIYDGQVVGEGNEALTFEIVLTVYNKFHDSYLMVPRLDVDLIFLNKSVGRLWTREEARIAPYSAGLWSIYAEILIGNNSGVYELITAVFQLELDPMDLDLDLFLGLIPLTLKLSMGTLIPLVLGGTADEVFDVENLLADFGGGDDLLGGLMGGEGGRQMLDWTTGATAFAKNKTVEEDFRLLVWENDTFFQDSADELLIGASHNAWDRIEWANATSGNNATGIGNYTWQYWRVDRWIDVSTSDSTNGFNKTGIILFTGSMVNWTAKKILNFPEYFWVKCTIYQQDPGKVLMMDALNSKVSNSTYVAPELPVISAATITPDSGKSGTTFSISATATHSEKIKSVTAYIQYPDGTNIATLPMINTGGYAYEITWDSAGQPNGTYYVDITAIDKSEEARSKTANNIDNNIQLGTVEPKPELTDSEKEKYAIPGLLTLIGEADDFMVALAELGLNLADLLGLTDAKMDAEIGVLFDMMNHLREYSREVKWIKFNVDGDDNIDFAALLKPGADAVQILLNPFLAFAESHDIDLLELIAIFDLNFQEIMFWLAESYNAWSTINGTQDDGVYIYSINQNQAFPGVLPGLTFQLLLIIGALGCAAIIFVYYGMKRGDPRQIFKDLKNLPDYSKKVEEELKAGISTEDLEFLKGIDFKPKDTKKGGAD